MAMRAPSRLARAIALAGSVLLLQASLAAADTPEDLPAGEGRDETFFACSACHGLALVKMQGQTRPQWDATIDLMIQRHGMPEMDPAERALVLDYLAQSFPPRQRGRPNPFLNQ